MSANAILVCKAPSLKDTHLFDSKEFRTPVPQLNLAAFTRAKPFHADLSNSQGTSEGKPVYLLSLPTINFADKVFSDWTNLNALYLAIISPSPGKRKENFLPPSPPGVFCAALSAAALLCSVRGCWARTTLSRGLRGVKEPSSWDRGGWGGRRGRCSGAGVLRRREPAGRVEALSEAEERAWSASRTQQTALSCWN